MPIDARHPREIRRDIRNGKLTGITAGLGANHVQANLAVLPRDYAYDFLLFCQRNPRPCPLLEVTDVGSAEPVGVAPGADLRTDIPRYRIYTHGELTDEVTDATPYWRDDLVAFCSAARSRSSGRCSRPASVSGTWSTARTSRCGGRRSRAGRRASSTGPWSSRCAPSQPPISRRQIGRAHV